MENLNPNTSKDSLENYIEVTSKLEVLDVQFGENRNALVTFSEEPGISPIMSSHEAGLTFFKCAMRIFLSLWQRSFSKKI